MTAGFLNAKKAADMLVARNKVNGLHLARYMM